MGKTNVSARNTSRKGFRLSAALRDEPGGLQERFSEKKTTAVHPERTRGQSDRLRSRQGSLTKKSDERWGGFSAHGGGWSDAQSERASKVEQNYGSVGFHGVVGRKWPSAPSLSLSPSSSSGLGPAMPMPVICILCVFVVGLLQPFSLSRETRAPRGDTRCCYCGRACSCMPGLLCNMRCVPGERFNVFFFHRVYAGWLLGSCWVGAVLGGARDGSLV